MSGTLPWDTRSWGVAVQEVIRLLERAGHAVLEVYAGEVNVQEKADASPVTEADFRSEHILRQGLEDWGYPVLSEEAVDDARRLSEDIIWVVDPLDGTNDFIAQTGEFSLMVGLAQEGRPVIGLVYWPTERIVYGAVAEQGAHVSVRGGAWRPLQVSGENSLSRARMVWSRSHLGALEEEFMRRVPTGSGVQKGSVGLKLGAMAAGEVDAYLSLSGKTSQWDVCAPEVILTEAGGKVTDVRGEQYRYNRPGLLNRYGIVASNGTLHQELVMRVQDIIGDEEL